MCLQGEVVTIIQCCTVVSYAVHFYLLSATLKKYQAGVSCFRVSLWGGIFYLHFYFARVNRVNFLLIKATLSFTLHQCIHVR